ncbi:SDR family oxidoreductase [Halocynthiibacter namhaensis]|uniref:SDR family oxidoreductase n=1 Tax=Halocynthiibacter namhaensis TaxID=1290553 RepID=UPI0005797A2E|nr:SDR family oxidoreductase [Halocynthiibacter namhaensis]
MKVLILGGYGVFGGRLAELIADVDGIEILIAGRGLAKAQAFCAGHACFTPVQAHRDEIATAISDHHPDILVDATGPFQDYGDAPYSVIKACIAGGVNYFDFADGADFVTGVAQFDAEAKAAGVFVLSGVSSFPVLTAAVLRHFEQDMDVQSVEGGIAPSPYAGVGMNVMRAVVGYAGNPVPLMRDGEQATGVALGESRYYTISVPGKLPLRNIRFSLVEVPELQVLPPEMPGLHDIWMGAGPGPETLHRGLNLLAKLRVTLKLPALTWLAPLCYKVLNLLKFGEHRGGMYIEVQGRAKSGARQGQAVTRSWHMLAEGDDGPYVPSMAIEALIRKVVRGETPVNGAGAAIHALELADYDALFANRDISTGFRENLPGQPIYREILGSAFNELDAPLRELHDSRDIRSWSGQVQARAAKTVLGRLAARLAGFPTQDAQGPVTVTFTPDDTGELWQRDFGGYKFQTHQSKGCGRNSGLLVEAFGRLKIGLAVTVENGTLQLMPRRWTLFMIPLPRMFLPRGDTFERAANGQFQFDVQVEIPLIGHVVAYKGVLMPD